MSKKVLLLITSVLFLGAVIWVLASLSIPAEKEERVTHLTYDIEGSFNHQAYEKLPPEEAMPSPRYFTKVIESVEVYYSYWFLPETPVTSVTEQVAISAVVGSASWGETEVEIVPRTERVGDFTISFPLDTTPLIQLADNITKELGAAPSSPDITFKAVVHTVAQTATGVLEDDFVQTVRLKAGASTLEWVRPLSLSQIGYAKGLKYEQQGNFSYAVKLMPNILYGAVTMVPEMPPPRDPAPLKSSNSYPSKTIDRIDGTLAYKVTSSQPLSQVVNEVEVTAMLGKTEGQHETFILVPRSQQTGDFSVTFPLDMPLFYAIGRLIEKETGATASFHDLTITADVHTIAQSNFGPVDETFSQSLTVILMPDKVAWPEVKPKTKSGSIEETLVVPNPSAGTAKVVSLGALGMMAVALLYSIWSYWEFKHKWISRLEADALQVRNRHQDLVVDVAKLPDIAEGETIIELGSLGELIKAADGLLKPVLRLAESEKHTYCIIDGATHYQYVSLRNQYVSLSQESATYTAPEPSPPPDETSSA